MVTFQSFFSKHFEVSWSEFHLLVEDIHSRKANFARMWQLTFLQVSP